MPSPPDATASPGPSPSEDWFRTLAETTAVAILVADGERFLYANPAAERILGRSAADLLTRSPIDLVHPDERADAASRLHQRLRGERPRECFDVRFARPDGTYRCVHLCTSRIDLPDRSAVLASGVDVSEQREADFALRDSRERVRLAQQAARYITWEWNLDTDELTIDDTVQEVFGISAAAAGRSGGEFLARVHPDSQVEFRRALARVRDGDGRMEAEIRVVLPGGRVIWLAERGRRIPGRDGVARVVGVATDISERKRAEAELQHEKERAQITLASIGDGVIRTDAEGRIDYMNPVAERLVGCSLAEALGRPVDAVYRVVDETTARPLADPVALCLEQRRVVELSEHGRLGSRDGQEFTVEASAAPLLDREGDLTGAVLVFRDVTRLRGMEQEVSYLASHDALTGLLNRRELERRLERLLPAAGSRGALVHLDLDELKVINDTCGHTAGDELLRGVAAVLAETAGKRGVVARLGGDEFAVLFPDLTPAEARLAAEELRAAVADHRFVWNGNPFDVRASVGLVHFAGTGEGLAPVMTAADAACWMAKEAGRDRVHEYQADDRAVARRHGEMQWVQRIHSAFEEDRFCLYRQSIRPLDGKGPEMHEVLIRMRNRDGEVIPPGSFIPAAERYHLIPAIDRWVVRTAIGTLARRAPADGGRFTLNVSGQSLGDETFLDDVIAALEEHGLDPGRLCLEITETAAVAHLTRAHRFMAVLRALGCRFVLDDFGSGMASFAYLKNLPVDYLKISSQFVRGVESSDLQRALVTSIHQIGDLLQMGTIAEGVENAEALACLEEIGVHFAQGYHLHRPEPL